MAFFNKIKLLWKFFNSIGKINQYQQIFDCREKLLEKQKKIEELEKEMDDLKASIKINDNFSIKNQFKEIDEKKNSCK